MGETTQQDLSAMIEEHLPLVKHIVFQVAVHFPRHVEREELARAGALGLVEAARRYDESRGVPFERFAAQRIRGAILDAVRAADWAPRSVRMLARKLENRELHGYLRDAISLLPERHRLVVIGYFLEGRTSQELARFLGVTESRVSQLRSEALLMLKDGIEAQYLSPEAEEPVVTGRVARRKANYAAAIADATVWTDRMRHVQLIESSAAPVPVA